MFTGGSNGGEGGCERGGDDLVELWPGGQVRGPQQKRSGAIYHTVEGSGLRKDSVNGIEITGVKKMVCHYFGGVAGGRHDVMPGSPQTIPNALADGAGRREN
ncbi:hypothetical protein AEYBE204_10535 [Asticcacaulis sp. YBE204]|nr:hypothetical protein AEYBE204_10535 [Asticcacaulis sp. YBE204]